MFYFVIGISSFLNQVNRKYIFYAFNVQTCFILWVSCFELKIWFVKTKNKNGDMVDTARYLISKTSEDVANWEAFYLIKIVL